MTGTKDSVRLIEGQLTADGARVGILVSRFNSFITERLLEGALDVLQRSGVRLDDVTVARTPGAWELPVAARAMAHSGHYEALICLGAVIRGSTPHFDYVANEAAKGIAHVSLETGVPIGFGVLTTDTIEQAVERAGTKQGNKGGEAAHTVLEMISLMRALAHAHAQE